MGEFSTKHGADHHRHSGAIPGVFGEPRLGQGSVGCLKQHELQRVSGGNLLGWHLVPPPVVGKALDEPPQTPCRLPWVRPGRIEHPGTVPAVSRHRSDRRLAGVEQGLKGREMNRSGKHTAGPDDGNWLSRRDHGTDRSDRYLRLWQIFGNRHVDVQATDAECVDGRLPRAAVGSPGPGFRYPGDTERAGLPVELIIESAGGTAGRDAAVLDRKHNLDQAR